MRYQVWGSILPPPCPRKHQARYVMSQDIDNHRFCEYQLCFVNHADDTVILVLDRASYSELVYKQYRLISRNTTLSTAILLLQQPESFETSSGRSQYLNGAESEATYQESSMQVVTTKQHKYKREWCRRCNKVQRHGREPKWECHHGFICPSATIDMIDHKSPGECSTTGEYHG